MNDRCMIIDTVVSIRFHPILTLTLTLTLTLGVTLTLVLATPQNNSGNRDNKTYVLCPTLQTRTCIGVLKSIIMFFHSFIAMEYTFTLFFYC